MFVRALVFASLVAVTLPAAAQDTFVPSRYKARIEAAHESDSPDHVLKVRILTHAVTNMSDGSVKVTGLTQILDGKTGKLVSQSRCSPCEEKATAWPDRPTGVWFTEASWPTGSTVARAKALILMSHFDRYFKLVRVDGTEKNGITYQFWKFEGRRGEPLPDADADAEKAKAEEKPKGPKYGPVEQVQIFFGQSKPDTVTTAVGQDSVQLKAVAYAAPEGSTVLSEVPRFFPMWSASCGKISDPRQKQITFTLAADVSRCPVFLYEGMTGKHDMVTVVRGQRPRPPVRVAITFGGGREADGVVLKGGQRTLELEAHAFRPDGSEIQGFEPEWDVPCGKVELLDAPSKRRLKLHVAPGTRKCVIHARDPKTHASDEFLIQVGGGAGASASPSSSAGSATEGTAEPETPPIPRPR